MISCAQMHFESVRGVLVCTSQAMCVSARNGGADQTALSIMITGILEADALYSTMSSDIKFDEFQLKENSSLCSVMSP